MAEVLTPDLCVIGAGAAGLAAAAGAAGLGASVVLIERGPLGGQRLNTGCVPTQAMIAAARRAHMAAAGLALGVKSARPKIDFTEINDHVQATIAAAAPNSSKERLTGLGVRLIEAEARFADPGTVVAGSATEVRARRFVIATGSSPSVPDIDGIGSVPYLTSDDVFDLRVCPRHLIVLGADPAGLALAQAFLRLGAEVTVVAPGAPLAGEDRECADILLGCLVDEGVRIVSGPTPASVSRNRNRIQVTFDGGEPIEGSHLLVMGGRTPNTGGLGLAAARIRHGADGIPVDANHRTTNKRVYAVGDVTVGPRFTHVAQHHAGLVVRHALLGRSTNRRGEAIPRALFTEPGLAHVGLTEDQARARRLSVRIARWPFAENDRANVVRTTAGHIKVVVGRGDRVLGVTIVGPDAAELIAPWSLAVSRGLGIDAFSGPLLPHPTLGEAGTHAVAGINWPRLTVPIVRRIITRLRRFG